MSTAEHLRRKIRDIRSIVEGSSTTNLAMDAQTAKEIAESICPDCQKFTPPESGEAFCNYFL